MNALGQIIDLVLWLFILLMFVRFIFDWVQLFARDWTPSGPLLIVLEIIYSITDPPIRVVQRVVPPLNLGGARLDLSAMIVLIAAYVLKAINAAVLLS